MRRAIQQRRRRRGVAIVVELLLMVGVLALVLSIALGWYQYVLDRAKTQQAAVMLAALDRSVRTYAEVCGVFPPDRPDGDMQRMLPMLLSVPAAKGHLQPLVPALLFSVDGRPQCRDPWGTPVRYFTAAVEDPLFRRRVQLNRGVPVFECAGPDRRFGDDDQAEQADNLRSDEPLDVRSAPGPSPTSRPGGEQNGPAKRDALPGRVGSE